MFEEESENKFEGLETNSQELKQDENQWVRQQLADLWGNSKAEYFLNPSQIAHSNENDSMKDHSSLASMTRKARTTGMFAHMIWDNIRNDSKKKAKIYDLQKELQEKMDSFMRNAKLKSGLSENNKNLLTSSKAIDVELAKYSRVIDMTRLNKTKILRNEIELMYRSSKMNEERMMLMRTNSPLPDLNDAQGKESIVRYLPSINLNTDVKTSRVDSSLEFATYSSTKNKKRNETSRLEPTHYNLIDAKLDSNSNKTKLKIESVKLHFLPEKPHREYMKKDLNETNTSHLDLDNSHNKTPIKDLVLFNGSSNTTNNVHFDQNSKPNDDLKSISYPPLTMNALMEYKPLIKAPGVGDFDNGRPKLFRYLK